MQSLIEMRGVGKVFSQGEATVEVLSGLDFTLEPGTSCAVVGKSGSGKSTFLEIAATLLRPTSGSVKIEGADVASMGERALNRVRNSSLGFIFQNSRLLGDFNALENVMMPALIAGRDEREARRRAESLLEQVGVSHRLTHLATELSGGERQRVAVARALMMKPSVVFADEPTGSLDEKSALVVESLLFSLVKQEGSSLLLVTHNREFALRCEKLFKLEGGKLREV